ncbi:MAG: hypothetical protein Q9M91_06950 [Candidatus Dojkabacteria bacterium]|nr:hypothetical protein [Candidatus Dojkabacteria bacterium]MDQ7021531.1 hypothetical protein [Candidatus Dojkabacteria bacterium]
MSNDMKNIEDLAQESLEAEPPSQLQVVLEYVQTIFTQSAERYNIFANSLFERVRQSIHIGSPDMEATNEMLKEGGAIIIISPHNTAFEIPIFHALIRNLSEGRELTTFNSRLPLIMPPGEASIEVEVRLKNIREAMAYNNPQAKFSGYSHLLLHHILGGGLFINEDDKTERNNIATDLEAVNWLRDSKNLNIFPQGMAMAPGSWRRGIARMALNLMFPNDPDMTSLDEVPLVIAHNGLRSIKTVKAGLIKPTESGGIYLDPIILKRSDIISLVEGIDTPYEKAGIVLSYIESKFKISYQSFIEWAIENGFDNEQIEWLNIMHMEKSHTHLYEG